MSPNLQMTPPQDQQLVDPEISIAITRLEVQILTLQAKLLVQSAPERNAARDLSPLGGGYG